MFYNFWEAPEYKRNMIRENALRYQKLVEWELCYKELENGNIIIFFNRGTTRPVKGQQPFNFDLDNILYDELEDGYFITIGGSQGQYIPKLK